MMNIVLVALTLMFFNQAYADMFNNLNKTIKIEYIAGDIDHNIVNDMKKLYRDDVLEINKTKIMEDGDICPLLRERGLYRINCTKELSSFITEINEDKKVFKKGDLINLPKLEIDTEYINQLTRASNFISVGKKSISRKSLFNQLKRSNYRSKHKNSFRIKRLSDEPEKGKFDLKDQLLISNIEKTKITYITKSISENSDFGFGTKKWVNHEIVPSSSSKKKLHISNNHPIVWNSFISRRNTIKDYSMLKPGIEDYKVILHLAAFKYDSTSVNTQGISSSFIESVDRLCSDWNGENWTEKLRIIPISNSKDILFIGNKNDFSSHLDMGKLCGYRYDKNFNNLIKIKGKDLKDFIKYWEKQKFIFFNKSFTLSTTKNASGNYSIAFSIWHRNKPIDEIVMNLCVSNNSICTEPLTYTHTKSNIQQIANDVNVSRVASLHFFDFNNDNIAALFWDNNSSSIESWLIDKEYLNTGISTISAEFNVEFPKYKELSERLSERVFGENKEIAKKFRTVLDVENKKPFSYLGGKIPEVYVRSIDTQIDNLDGVPIGLLPLGDDYNISKLLGLHYKIYRPLNYSETPKTICINQTGLMYPQAKGDDTAINIAIETRNEAFKKYVKGINGTSIDSSSSLEKWTITHKENQKLFIFLGHFGVNSKLGFTTSEGIVEAGHFRKGHSSSIAILDACGTGVKDGGKFISGLNAAGFGTIIATNAEISAYLGQEYLNCFVIELEKNKDRKIGNLHANTLKCLYDIPKKCHDKDSCQDYSDEDNIRERNFEMDVLKYTLYGAHNVEICK